MKRRNRAKRLKNLKLRQHYNGEVAEFFAERLVEAELEADVPTAERCRKRLDDLDDESVYLEGAIIRAQRKT